MIAMKICLISLGCSKNLVDSEIMLGVLKKNGFSITEKAESADIAVVNTCAFIKDAKEEAIDTILELAKLKQSGKLKKLIVAGCLPQRYQGKLTDLLQEVDAFLGPGRIDKIADIIALSFSGKRSFSVGKPHFSYKHDTPRVSLTPQHFAYVKIADGCDNCCHYCVIPQIRGPYRSRPVGSIVREVQALTERGVKEINLISQDTTFYGQDRYRKAALSDLLKRLVKLKKLQWIRILYTHPRHFDDSLMNLIARESKICSYIDLPIQHISDKILKLMGRKVSAGTIKRKIAKMRRLIPDLTLRTSLIVGFPQETERDFKKLFDFVREIKFDRLGVFAYSAEEDTKAAVLGGQIPEKIKRDRVKKIMRLQQGIVNKKNNALIGSEKVVLIDELQNKNTAMGRTQADAPDVDGVVFVKGKNIKPGDRVKVKITDALVYDLIGNKI
ncbi:MAG: 30S ribosomal protein S12 methylthiotransferase RimO [PVC group bacterium]|nr:30S ribosomal protein S12 methylthiotransferase RimO [PVC group bacterium]